ncbi:tripartite tricarboxylate transporter substrate binding protein [Actinomadura darangshiensis]|uniref:Tripartite tricarboxylate transporter substrate binding protein n=1 Tax=Actinomadura darangshiensis TaxID=705336 RepID=A0A4R5B9Y9_9ACTN|nr:tripartite tricarboxylate transporter substrate binding protein [Actinomadura darangshiensis]TDD81470.1 tripartite tricarboxylate transporter substrate binding protein [Actinomadura darangshiensis]
MKARPVGKPRSAVLLVTLACALVTAACDGSPAQQAYPARDVQLIVPYPAGSAIDTTARALADVIGAQHKLGRRVQVVNRAGGAGSVGTTAALNAKPAGYTIGLVPDGPLTLIPQTEKVPYDAKAATVLSEVTTSPVLFAVPGDSPFKNVGDLVAAAKARPDAVTIGDGPLNYTIPARKFEQLTGTRLKHVKFDGDQATTTALLGGNIDVGVMQLAGGMAQLKSGKLRALAIATAERVGLASDVPTFVEQNVQLQWQAYNVVVAPEDLPAKVEQKLSTAINSAIKDPKFAQTAQKLGLVVSGADGKAAKARLAEKTTAAASLLPR